MKTVDQADVVGTVRCAMDAGTVPRRKLWLGAHDVH